MSTSKLMTQFRQQEADTIAMSVQFHRWSQSMIALMIQEQEKKLEASDEPVEVTGEGDDFWEQMGTG